jgi:hypothetical protein
MDPITLAILAGTAATAAGQLPQLIPSKFEKENKRRLEELQRQQKAGTLGLTGKEEALMERRLAGRSQAAAMGAEAERNRLLAGSGGAQAGGALLGAQLADEERQRAEERISTDIMAADLERKRQQEEEMRALSAAEGQSQAEAQAAAGAIIGSGIEAGVTTAAQERLFAGARNPSTQSVQALSTSLGVSSDEARGYIELAATNPEMFRYITLVKGQKAGGQ